VLITSLDHLLALRYRRSESFLHVERPSRIQSAVSDQQSTIPWIISAARMSVSEPVGRGPFQPRDRPELVVSVNTVKTHVKSIYRKLNLNKLPGAPNRPAVESALLILYPSFDRSISRRLTLGGFFIHPQAANHPIFTRFG
jgi:hypothetical protein